ncbi:hypothetical protein CY34DRAFT_799980 [Suillus luteus UH-Slu-Lm8-n1]|uniref:Unplaced genomic scaffold CY34scaffold_23, whole genome shotgun sequence n=1 Tax=Suillus luteus UH-Slu-Lm8-n1 TaxID=930992 RepID=A0A0D0A9C9_9AGAM|nr:hypothetical protein CY34DRAFT_799980 [Suillus luteus UH-Slu-Lm8-n1]
MNPALHLGVSYNLCGFSDTDFKPFLSTSITHILPSPSRSSPSKAASGGHGSTCS